MSCRLRMTTLKLNNGKNAPLKTVGAPVFKAGELGNYEPPQGGPVREGPGEMGRPYKPHNIDPNEVSVAMMEYGINMAASDQIPLDRSIPDLRMPECKYWHYPEDLPTTSVVIVFHNEGWSTLLRTVHSVLNRSPPQFLHEVVLVDDFSDKENLKGSLDNYIRQFGGRVKLYRNAQREGLIRSRTLGAQHAQGEVVLFLDAHCEVNVNWLPPLLAPIGRNRTVMTVPVIDGVDKDNFEYRPVYKETSYRGIFEWGMLYKETEIPRREEAKRRHKSEPYKSPTHAGGLFAINRRYFLELGAYDPGLLVWGGENFELSFKVGSYWLNSSLSCLWLPDLAVRRQHRVGPLQSSRPHLPLLHALLLRQAGREEEGTLGHPARCVQNYKRVVEVWMDEYKEYFYTREPMAMLYDAGDINEQLALKKRLGCRPFKWYMENVAYDVLEKYPVLPRNLYWGEVRSELTGQCLDTMSSHPPATVHLAPCHGSGGNQVFRLNAEGQLGVGERCVDGDSQAIRLVFCRLGSVDGPWTYDAAARTLSHRNHGKCLDYNRETNVLALRQCAPSFSPGQRWTFHALTARS
ncbi:GALNT7 [Cordylochernes scorpioides]|uniref:Polypeptide N-acetylgalactosaminyltransferase n=1 Tax=Cordylochernes scorpioides TaxID=51811 RepID=A0ABY6K084_9ARAC|nr:GALNT7 [Cordylochernes scorpioides]